MTELDPKLTFETFVVGPANRLASAASRRAADSPGTSYNPLFLYASSGLGKSHLLVAVANHAARHDAQLRVRYQTLEGFLDELARALEAGSRDELRESYRDLDILLMDDVQFLAGQPEAQEMLLVTLDALTASGSQVVLASDRPPAEIDGLDARLVSRFSGGLIVDIAAPEFETRVAIIRRKVAERGQELESGVAEALARYPLRNVRELGGALNRVLATQDLEGRAVTTSDIPQIMGDKVPGGGAPELRGSVDDFGDFLNTIAGTVEEVVETRQEPWRKAYRETAEAAEREGFVVRRLRSAVEGAAEPEGWQEKLETFKGQIGRLREIDAELDRLNNPWPEAAASVVKDPDRVEEAEALLASVEERVRPFPALAEGPDLVELEGGVPTLAFKSVLQLVADEKPQYNPVFVWGESGRASRALLAAAGRTFAGRRSESRAAVTSVADFAQDFIRALSQGVAGAWRERWWTLDLLLVHGAEALTDTERAQDEFFHLFEALKRRGARVLITADRPPARIAGIDERLRSRFEGGLVVEASVTGTIPPGADEIRTREASREPESRWGSLSGESSPAADAVREPAVRDAEVTFQPPTDELPSAEISMPPLDEFDLGDGRGGLFHDEATEDPVAPAPAEAWASEKPPTPAQPPRRGEPTPAEAPAARTDAPAPDPAEPAPERARPSPGSWVPSRERVVWRWPDPDERLVEEME